MNNHFTLRGSWFLPNSKNIKVPGTITFDHITGIKLTLEKDIHTGKSGSESFWNQMGEVDLILGILSNKQAITLYKCYETRSSFGGVEGFISEWTANYTFKNIHLFEKSQLTFTKIRAEITYLFEWLNQSGISVDGLKKLDEEIIIKFNRPQAIKFPIDSCVNGQFEFSYSFDTPSSHSSAIELKQSAYLVIETLIDCTIDFDKVQDYLNHFLNWLTIATRYDCKPLKITLYNKHLVEKYKNGEEYPIHIELYTYSFRMVEKPAPKRFYEFNFNYTQLKNEMPDLLTRWYSLYPSLTIVNQILAEYISNENSFNETVFKEIVQGLESFHRIRRNNQRIDKEEYESMKITILNDIQDVSYRKFIEEKLHFGNEPTLADRLHALINEAKSPTLNLIIGDQNSFVKSAKNNRNYYTHYDSSQKRKALRGSDLRRVSEKLLALLMLTVLNEVFNNKIFVDSWLRTARRWAYLVSEGNN